MGLLNFLDSEEAQMGLGLLAAAGQRSDGANFGQRMIEGMGQAQTWKKNKNAQKLLDMQMEEAQRKVDKAKADAEIEARFNAGVGQFFKPGQAALSPLMGDPSIGMMPSQGRDAVAPSIDQQGLGMFMAQNGRLEDGLKLLQKEKPKFSTAPQYDQNGRAFVLAEDGSMKYLSGVSSRDKLIETDLGGTKGFRTEYSPTMLAQLAKTQSPDSKASNALGWANNSLSRERLNFDKAGGAEGGKPPAGPACCSQTDRQRESVALLQSCSLLGGFASRNAARARRPGPNPPTRLLRCHDSSDLPACATHRCARQPAPLRTHDRRDRCRLLRDQPIGAHLCAGAARL